MIRKAIKFCWKDGWLEGTHPSKSLITKNGKEAPAFMRGEELPGMKRRRVFRHLIDKKLLHSCAELFFILHFSFFIPFTYHSSLFMISSNSTLI